MRGVRLRAGRVMSESQGSGQRPSTGAGDGGAADKAAPLSSGLDTPQRRSTYWARVRADGGNLALLLLLYLLQGIPMGLAGSIPLMLQDRGASYADQAQFSFVAWPYSLKLLWAPVVDAVYSRRMGRRKSWLVPVQLLVGACMLALSTVVEQLLADVRMLTVVFFALYFLVATQDIAVDGWALTMLRRENVGLASTCNTVGQTAGYFISYTLFLAFSSPAFCKRYLGSPQGVITLPGFMRFWGVVFVVCTLGVWALKQEVNRRAGERAGATKVHDSELGLPAAAGEPGTAEETAHLVRGSRAWSETSTGSSPGSESSPGDLASPSDVGSGGDSTAGSSMSTPSQPRPRRSRGPPVVTHLETAASLGLVEGGGRVDATSQPRRISLGRAYAQILAMLRLPAVLQLLLMLLTVRVGSSAAEAAAHLQLLDKGFPKEHLAVLAVAFFPLELVFTVLVGKYTAGPRPLDYFMMSMPWRAALALAMAGLVALTPDVRELSAGASALESGVGMPWWVYVALVALGVVHRLACNFMFVSVMSFFASISDPRVGGTYMTMLNTVANLGGMWPVPVVFWLIDRLSITECHPPKATDVLPHASCAGDARAACLEAGGRCATVVDGFYSVALVCGALAVVWWVVWRRRVRQLQSLPESAWLCPL